MWSPITAIGRCDSTISTVEATAKPTLQRLSLCVILLQCSSIIKYMVQANSAAKHWPGYQIYNDQQLILDLLMTLLHVTSIRAAQYEENM